MVPALSIALRLSDLPLAQRAAHLLDASSIEAHWAAGSLRLSTGRMAGHPVSLAITDRSQSGGAFGVEECAGLQALLQRAPADAGTVVLVLASGGARLDQGLAALGAFRRLFAAVLAAWAAGRRLLAVVHGDCFGGASLLACAAQARIGVRGGRFGLSGPGIIEALASKAELDASDRAAVRDLFGVDARYAAQILTALCDDDVDALRAAVTAAIARDAAADDLPRQHERLRQRLVEAAIALPSRTPDWTGFCGGQPVSARDCWLAADWLLQRAPGEPIDIALDAPGQATTRLDERIGLSEFAVHLAQCLMRLRAHGAAVNLKIAGQAGGAIYVALAAPASSVTADPGARVHVLPPEAVNRVLRSRLPDEDIHRARDCGVVDALVSA